MDNRDMEDKREYNLALRFPAPYIVECARGKLIARFSDRSGQWVLTAVDSAMASYSDTHGRMTAENYARAVMAVEREISACEYIVENPHYAVTVALRRHKAAYANDGKDCPLRAMEEIAKPYGV
jgi:hypothetical protein